MDMLWRGTPKEPFTGGTLKESMETSIGNIVVSSFLLPKSSMVYFVVHIIVRLKLKK